MKSTAIPPPLHAGDDLRNQFGAVCWRMLRGRLQVLLITSRDTGRWVIPKGWPMEGLSPEDCAAQEAFEEAGVMGRVSAQCLGMFAYDKALVRGPGTSCTSVPCMVAVYPLRVSHLTDRFPEAGQRRRKWFSRDKAAERVAEPELQVLLAGFAPDMGGEPGATA